MAIVIANADYPDASAPIPRVISNARAVADQLRSFDFDVTFAQNLSRAAFQEALQSLYKRITPGTAVIVFFTGYGIQTRGQNFLIPVNASIWNESDIAREAISVSDILQSLGQRGAALRIIILDASRRNPFERRFRTYSAGLALIPAPPDSIIVSATRPGKVTSDSENGNMFVSELLKEIGAPNRDANDILSRTQVGVSRATDGEQVPWISDSLSEKVYLGKPAKDAQEGADGQAADRKASPLDAAQGTLSPSSTDKVAEVEQPAARQSATAPSEKKFSGGEPTSERHAGLSDAADAPAALGAGDGTGATAGERRASLDTSPLAPSSTASTNPKSLDAAPADARPRDNEPNEKAVAANPGKLIRSIQTELKRIGCYTGSVDESGWSKNATRSALRNYAHLAGLTDVSPAPEPALLDRLRQEHGRVCPLICSERQIERNGHCVLKTCHRGEILDIHGDCVTRRLSSGARATRANSSAARNSETIQSRPRQARRPVASVSFPKPAPVSRFRCFVHDNRSYCE